MGGGEGQSEEDQRSHPAGFWINESCLGCCQHHYEPFPHCVHVHTFSPWKTIMHEWHRRNNTRQTNSQMPVTPKAGKSPNFPFPTPLFFLLCSDRTHREGGRELMRPGVPPAGGPGPRPPGGLLPWVSPTHRRPCSRDRLTDGQ